MATIQDKDWYKEGIQFECQGSGKCCTSHGEFGYVYLTYEDRKRLAKHLGLRVGEFNRQYCERPEGVWQLKETKQNGDCSFLEGKRCSVYEARPTQCRTWPFWPEVLNAKAWSKEVASFCPGVGRGRTYSFEEIESIKKEQEVSEKKYGG